MATQTTYYEFNKPQGSDLVNPLTDTNPNWDLADAALHELNERSFANATETVVLGVHAISRLNTYTKFIKWIATANFTAGDTFTVDGNVVAASTPSGASLADDAYVSGAVVIACLNADDSAMTIFVSGTNVATDSARLGGELPSYYATASDMSNAQTDIGNIQALDGTTSIATIGDGTLTGAVAEINSNLTAVGNKYQASFQNNNYGFVIDGNFYQIGGMMNKNIVFPPSGSSATYTIDISNLDNASYVSIGGYGDYKPHETVTVSTIKGYTTEHTVPGGQGNQQLYVQYSDGIVSLRVTNLVMTVWYVND